MGISYNYGRTNRAPRNTYGSNYRKKYRKSAMSVFRKRFNKSRFSNWFKKYKR